MANSNAQTQPQTTAPQTDRQDDRGNDFHEIIGKIVDVLVKIIATPAVALARFLENFIDISKPGIKALGAALLVIGVILSADTFFQSFGGKALFPFWEDSWIGAGWLYIWTTVPFWCAVTIALGVQWIESYALRGKSPEQAKADYEAVKSHVTPDRNSKAIDLVEARRRDYKRAGMQDRTLLGLVILLVFILDIGSTFSARPFWGEEPTRLIAIVLYNVLTMMAGETGFTLWLKANGK